jgi:hypothetical protein
LQPSPAADCSYWKIHVQSPTLTCHCLLLLLLAQLALLQLLVRLPLWLLHWRVPLLPP